MIPWFMRPIARLAVFFYTLEPSEHGTRLESAGTNTVCASRDYHLKEKLQHQGWRLLPRRTSLPVRSSQKFPPTLLGCHLSVKEAHAVHHLWFADLIAKPPLTLLLGIEVTVTYNHLNLGLWSELSSWKWVWHVFAWTLMMPSHKRQGKYRQ